MSKSNPFVSDFSLKVLVILNRPLFLLGVFAENPCPEQGDIIQIKLSEHTEVLPKADGTGSTTMLVDTVFEMNYSTGQWTRLKKYKPITNTSWDSAPAAPSYPPKTPHSPTSPTPNQPHVCTNTIICIHIRAKNETRSRSEVIKERNSSLFSAPLKHRTRCPTVLNVLFDSFVCLKKKTVSVDT